MAGSDPRLGRVHEPASDRGRVEAEEEDPLIELARIVSEDGGFSSPKTEKPNMIRNDSTQPSSDDDLESELLQELESSLSGREPPARSPRPTPRPVHREVPTPPPPRAAAPAPRRPVPVEDERDPDDLLRSIEEQLGQFERRQAGRIAAPAPQAAPSEPEWPTLDTPAVEPEEEGPAFEEPVLEFSVERAPGRQLAGAPRIANSPAGRRRAGGRRRG